mgnify:CR=1 FL=1
MWRRAFSLYIRYSQSNAIKFMHYADRGLVYTMGSNSDGRLGIGDRYVKKMATPTLVEDLAALNCVMVSCGWGHTVAIMGIIAENCSFIDKMLIKKMMDELIHGVLVSTELSVQVQLKVNGLLSEWLSMMEGRWE